MTLPRHLTLWVLVYLILNAVNISVSYTKNTKANLGPIGDYQYEDPS